METTNTPRRVVFRFHVRYERDEGTIIKQYFASTQSEKINFFIHTVPPNNSSKMHTVLDLHHIENPTVNLDEIPYEVFVVEKRGDLYVVLPALKSILNQPVSVFRKLEGDACKQASSRCRGLCWGAYYP